jgi:hypothetical protein
MRRSAASRCGFVLLVVLAMGLKALIPTGFMLAAVGGHAQLVMCPAGIHATAMKQHAAAMAAMMVMDASSSAHMMHAAGVDHSAHAALAAEQCPFAFASASVLPAPVPQVTEPYFTVVRPVAVAVVLSIPIAPPIRHSAPRGPPALA